MQHAGIVAFDQQQLAFVGSDDVARTCIAAERRELRAETLAQANRVSPLSFISRRDEVPARGELLRNHRNGGTPDARHVSERDDPAVRAAPLRDAMREARAHAARKVREHRHVAALLLEDVSQRKIALLDDGHDVQACRDEVARCVRAYCHAVGQRVQELVAAEARAGAGGE